MGIPTMDGFDRDEYPAAVGRGRGSNALKRGSHPIGWKADVEYVPSSENQSHGAKLGAKLKRLNRTCARTASMPCPRTTTSMPGLTRGTIGRVGLLPLAIPALVMVMIAATRPSPRQALLLAIVAAALAAPSAMLLVDAGGIECPRGCSPEQDALQSLVFLAIPLTVILLVVWAGAMAWRSRGSR